MTYAQMAQDGEMAVAPVSNQRIAGLETTRVIFFAGDAIPPNEKYEMPEVKGFGGVYLPHISTLPQGANQGSRGMVYRCRFTPLTTKMRPEWNMMLSPDARELWENEFVQTVTVHGESTTKNVKGFLGSSPQATKKGRLEHVESDHIVFKKRYPGQDIRSATTRTLPNGVGGVVEIEALQGASNQEIREAQLFFFPQWDDVVQGLQELPETTEGLEQYIRTRLATINKEDFSPSAQRYRLIARDMLRSCSEFKRTGSQIVKTDEKAVKAAAKDDSQSNSPISEHLLKQLNVTRKDDMVAGDHHALNRLATAMEKNVTQTPSGMNDEDLADYYAWRANRKKEAQEVTTTADTDGDGSPDFGAEDEVLPRLCGHPKADNEPCQRELKDGEIACFQHVSKSE